MKDYKSYFYVKLCALMNCSEYSNRLSYRNQVKRLSVNNVKILLLKIQINSLYRCKGIFHPKIHV